MDFRKLRGTASICALGLASLIVAACDDNNNPPGAATTPPPVAAVSPAGQSLAGVDPVNNTVWVPTYQLDGSGNLQLVVSNQSDVTPAAVSAVGAHAIVQPHATGTGKKVSLPQCDTPIALAYDTNNQTFLVECANSTTSQVYVQIVKTASLDNLNNPTVNTITATGVTWDTWGGILFNPNTDKAVVAGTNTIGILDVPKDGTPSFEANSVVQVPGTDSLSLNFTTQLLLVCSDGTNYTIDTSVRGANGQLPAPTIFSGPTGTTDGNAFDSSTNIATISPEFDNIAEIANFTGKFDAAGGTAPTAVPVLTVSGLGWLDPHGEGPGGQATFNITTHQAIIADEFGQNFWLVQLPSAAVTGALDNNGQPGSATTADASSAYAVAAGLIPQVMINNTSTQLGIRGDPAALGIDQVHNIAYMLADTNTDYHSWSGNSNTPLFLIAVDLSNAPVGGCAAGITLDGTSTGQRSTACTSVWSPKVAVLRIN